MTTNGSDHRIGWYGKVPSLGDFVRRGLPPLFIDGWDEWLRRAMLTGRQRSGASFDAALQGFPTWRFLLAPGLLGASAWCGVLQASTDRVGRVFPFTIAQSLPADEPFDCDAAWLETQLDGFAHTAVSALDQHSLQRFEGLVEQLPATPRHADLRSAPLLSATASIPATVVSQNGESACMRDWQGVLPMSTRLDRLAVFAGQRSLPELISGRCLWWIPPGADDHGAVLLADAPMSDDLLLTLLAAV